MTGDLLGSLAKVLNVIHILSHKLLVITATVTAGNCIQHSTEFIQVFESYGMFWKLNF